MKYILCKNVNRRLNARLKKPRIRDSDIYLFVIISSYINRRPWDFNFLIFREKKCTVLLSLV